MCCCASCHTCYCASRASYCTYSRASRVLHTFVPHLSCALLFLVLFVLVLCVTFCSSSLTCFRCFKPKILTCISCLLVLMFCSSCAFGAWVMSFLQLGLRLITVICHFKKRNTITMVFRLGDISLQDLLTLLTKLSNFLSLVSCYNPLRYMVFREKRRYTGMEWLNLLFTVIRK